MVVGAGRASLRALLSVSVRPRSASLSLGNRLPPFSASGVVYLALGGEGYPHHPGANQES